MSVHTMNMGQIFFAPQWDSQTDTPVIHFCSSFYRVKYYTFYGVYMGIAMYTPFSNIQTNPETQFAYENLTLPFSNRWFPVLKNGDGKPVRQKCW